MAAKDFPVTKTKPVAKYEQQSSVLDVFQDGQVYLVYK